MVPMARRPDRAACFVAALLALAACGDGDPGGEPPPPPPPPAVAIETTAPARIRAGDPIEVTCRVTDGTGQELSAVEAGASVVFAPADAVRVTDSGGLIATTAGDLQATCTATRPALFDPTPALVAVDPGPVAQLVTHLDRGALTAGEVATARCDGYDAWGNPAPAPDATLRAAPVDGGNTIAALTATMTRAGSYQLFCERAGADSAGAALEVSPGAPASLVASRVPDRAVYAIGEVVALATRVTDAYGNPVPGAAVAVASSPTGEPLGDARFRYFRDGQYVLTAIVPTAGDPLTASATVTVDGSGPAVRCEQPLDGAIVTHAPGTPITLTGSASDQLGITLVKVNGRAVDVAPDGAFQTSIPTQLGINFVDLTAVDGRGAEASRTCAFLVAGQWIAEGAAFADAISLDLAAAAVDDNNRSGGITSLGDLLHVVLNSTGLRELIDEELNRANPIKPSSCDSEIWGVCVLRTRMDYVSSELRGPNTVQLELINGGLQARIGLRDARLRLRITGNAGPLNIDSTGWATVTSIDVVVPFDVWLDGGRPRVAVRGNGVSTTVGQINTDFSGFDGWIIEIVVSIAQSRVRDLVANQLSTFIRGSFNQLLDGVLAGIDIGSLGASFDVPRLDGGPAIALRFDPGLTSLGTTTGRTLFGLSTRFTANAAHARPSLGSALQTPGGPLDPAVATPAAAGVHSGLLGQALHALWRAGFFDATLRGGALPEGVAVALATGLPPVARLAGADRVDLSLGSVDVVLTYPALFPEPIDLELGVRASVQFRRVGNDIEFHTVVLDELHVTTDQVSLDEATRHTLETFLSRVMGRIVGSALNDALPALPIPSFELPASVTRFGLPAGARLGLGSPTLSTEPPFFVLAGSLSIQ
jgi:hypothetical protein